MKQTKQQVDNDSRGYLIAQPPIAKTNEPQSISILEIQ